MSSVEPYLGDALGILGTERNSDEAWKLRKNVESRWFVPRTFRRIEDFHEISLTGSVNNDFIEADVRFWLKAAAAAVAAAAAAAAVAWNVRWWKRHLSLEMWVKLWVSTSQEAIRLIDRISWLIIEWMSPTLILLSMLLSKAGQTKDEPSYAMQPAVGSQFWCYLDIAVSRVSQVKYYMGPTQKFTDWCDQRGLPIEKSCCFCCHYWTKLTPGISDGTF